MIQVLEHPPLADDVADALRSYNWHRSASDRHVAAKGLLTVIFTDIFQGECKLGVFVLDDAYFAKGSLAHDAAKGEMV